MMRAVIKKEMRQIVRDPRTLAVLIALPLFLLVMFGYAISLDVRNAPVGVLDHDRSPESRALIAELQHNEYTSLAVMLTAESEVEPLMQQEAIRAALVIPADFSRSLLSGRRTGVQLLIDGTNGTTASALLGYLEAIVRGYGSSFAGNEGGRSAAAAAAPRIDFRPRVWFNPELESNRFLVPGLVAFLLVVTAVISTALSIVKEKEQGTMEQIIASPLRRLDLIIGKSVPYLAISLLVAGFVFVSSYFLFGVGIAGSVLWLAAVTLLFLFACLSFGIFISSIAESQQVAFIIAVLATLLPSFLLSGFVFPIENMPLPIQAVTYIVPARYYLSALRAIMLKGAGLSLFWPDALLLLLFTAAVLTAGSVRLSRGGVRA